MMFLPAGSIPTTLKIKPLSVNEAWQGRRFKTPQYKAYEDELMLRLPPKCDIPSEGFLEAVYEFGISHASDFDNPIKPFQDVLQKKYGFDDHRILKATIRKKIVSKGNNYLTFSIIPLIET